MNYAKLNAKPVQRDGAYSVRENIKPRTRKEAVGKFSKWADRWAIAIVDGHSLPHNMIVPVEKSDGTRKKVRLLTLQGSRQLQYAKLNFYSFTQLDS